jgi:integrase
MTRQGYVGLIRRHLEPTFGKTKLRMITPESVRSWHASVTTTAGRDAGAKSYRVLRAILNTAVTDDLIGRNPCRIKGAGLENAPERPMLDATIGDRYRALVLLAGFGGLRTGEMLGLDRRDVDPMRGEVHVRRQAHEVRGQGRITTGPKSDAGRRTVGPAVDRRRSPSASPRRVLSAWR